MNINEVLSDADVAPFVEWFSGLASSKLSQAQTPKIKELIERKVTHTYDAVQALIDIYQEQDELTGVPPDLRTFMKF